MLCEKAAPDILIHLTPQDMCMKYSRYKPYHYSFLLCQEGDFIRVEKNTETDWIWDWSSRPDQTPPKSVFFRCLYHYFFVYENTVFKYLVFNRNLFDQWNYTNEISFNEETREVKLIFFLFWLQGVEV